MSEKINVWLKIYASHLFIEISIPGYKDFEVTSLSVRLNADPPHPSPGPDDDEVVYLGTFSPSSPSRDDDVIRLD